MNTYLNFGENDVIESDIDVTCIGAFDGIHRGHLELINKTKQISNNYQVVTFNEIPKIYFNNDLKPLLNNKKRNNIFKKLKPTNLIYLKFDEINELSSVDFIKLLSLNLKTKKIVVGKDFKFGKNRTGDIDNIISFFGEENVILLTDYLIDNEKISSTKIRNYLDSGNIKKANKFLGRKYELSGKVVKGMELVDKIKKGEGSSGSVENPDKIISLRPKK